MSSHNLLYRPPMAPGRRRGQSSHQNAAHRLLTREGYVFDRLDGNQHNHYRNAHGQEIVAVCSPKNSSEGLNRLRNTIRAHKRQQKEAHVSTRTHAHMSSRTKTKAPEMADKLVAMADPFLLKELGPEDNFKSPAFKAKRQAYLGWLKRAYEKHGPLPADALETATDRMGFSYNTLVKARKELGVVAFREGAPGTMGGGMWYSCLPWQLPEEKKGYQNTRNQPPQAPLGVEVSEPEPSIENKASGVAPLADDRQPEPEPAPVESVYPNSASLTGPITSVPLKPLPASNGKPQLTDQQAAALMLLESLGIKQPGDEAKLALQKAAEALEDAHAALSNAMQALA